jgi:hypothetical protein
MAEQLLELRGIPLSQLLTYLRECAGQAETAADSLAEATLPLLVRTDEWQAEILREELVTITSRFHVNAVFIHFTAASEEILSRLLARFRIKVMRVGG